eukprot:gb/GECG01010190.1/.p1 GENE.gb/GECG01010190.1/~~gb/GECG01010190.1/.p1  ORF type:complete len:107 (+),score=5.51 gb/GECG01010190.1/:1-321(+)
MLVYLIQNPLPGIQEFRFTQRTILAACMRANVQAIEISVSEEARASPLACYEGHSRSSEKLSKECLAYGADFVYSASGVSTSLLGSRIVSCSFYDKTVQLWCASPG